MIERHSKARIPTLEVYTDGSLKESGKTTFGGWGFIVIQNDHKIYSAAGNEINTTNQRMELQAISEGLKYASSIRRPLEKISIYSDSNYAINCYMQEWYIQWMENGWHNSKHKPIANRDLWDNIIPYFDNYWYEFHHVNAHTNVFWNNEADELAQSAADYAKKYWRVL